jgi:hypothetical protein
MICLPVAACTRKIKASYHFMEMIEISDFSYHETWYFFPRRLTAIGEVMPHFFCDDPSSRPGP